MTIRKAPNKAVVRVQGPGSLKPSVMGVCRTLPGHDGTMVSGPDGEPLQRLIIDYGSEQKAGAAAEYLRNYFQGR